MVRPLTKEDDILLQIGRNTGAAFGVMEDDMTGIDADGDARP
ncbi:hypothetical protein [Azospirillum argentinense]